MMTKKRTHNPAWPDSKEARAARQAKRLAALNDLARAAGFETWRKLETATLAGEAIIVRHEKDTPPGTEEEVEGEILVSATFDRSVELWNLDGTFRHDVLGWRLPQVRFTASSKSKT